MGCKWNWIITEESSEKRRRQWQNFWVLIKKSNLPKDWVDWIKRREGSLLHSHGARGLGSMCLFGFGMCEGINGGLGFTFISIFIRVNAEKVGFGAPSMGLFLLSLSFCDTMAHGGLLECATALKLYDL